MGSITYQNYPYSDGGPDANLGSKVQADLDIAASVLNALTPSNFLTATSASISSLDLTTRLIAPRIRSRGDTNIVISLATFSGAKWRIKNSDGDTLIEIDSGKGVTVGQ